ncbi:MAG: FHA domain-containing protein [Actinomycetota bacterium]|nr:FHA domain-containing protein [Actinomycetota bacterium]
MTLLALAADETLLILKIVFLVLLYGFILLVVRSATKDIGGAPQESIILGAAEASALREELGVRPRPLRFRVLGGPGLPAGKTIEIGAATVIGREDNVGIHLDGDEFASGQHARLDPRADGAWVEDLGSTNGTFVNGERVTAQRLQVDDVIRVGQTELRLEA